MYLLHVLYMCRELNLLKESRERQKEMVESIVKQRDMYRILLAQSTPLPDEHTDTSQVRGEKEREREGERGEREREREGEGERERERKNFDINERVNFSFIFIFFSS